MHRGTGPANGLPMATLATGGRSTVDGPPWTQLRHKRRPARRAVAAMGRGGDGSVRRSARVQQVAAALAAAPVAKAAPQYERAPSERPPFTLGQLRAAVPSHCFQRSLLRSSAYLAADCLAAAACYAAATRLDAQPLAPALRLLLWLVYAVVQGTVCTGIWVIAHEAGHSGFSNYPLVNDTVGLVAHSALLVPYFSWKFSHGRHHAGTGSLTRDEVFVPPTAEQFGGKNDMLKTERGRVGKLVATLLLGWPLYLVKNAGSLKYVGRHADHFWPWSPVFTSPKERVLVAVSDAALVAVLLGLRKAAVAFGAGWVIRAYGLPLIVVNFWLVMITLLQHSHPSLPHFGDASWDWLRGACSTVDRDYGWLLNTLHHHIADTHVCHHIFSSLPHYHAAEATAALRKVMGPYARTDERNVFTALWQDWRDCVYVAPDDAPGAPADVFWFRSDVPLKAE